jgi:hypothetical protein
MTRGWLVIAMLVAAPVAFAQAPGEVAPTPPPASAPAPDPAMANRWGVALDVGGIGITPKSQPSAGATFAMIQLGMRFRATRHLELGLALATGAAKTTPEMPDGAFVSTLGIDLRCRLAPRRAWDAWIVGGLGALRVTPARGASRSELAAYRGTLGLGVGVERRFGRVALQAELRAFGLGASSKTPSVLASGAGSGLQLTLGAGLYF